MAFLKSILLGFILILGVAFVVRFFVGKGGAKYYHSWLGWWKTIHKCPKCNKNLTQLEYDNNICPYCSAKIK